MSAPRTVADLVNVMEPDIHDIGRWGSVVMDLAGNDSGVQSDSLFVIGQAIWTLGTALEAKWDEAFEASRIPATPAEPPAQDLLRGARAIAAHLGVPKGVARHLIRARLIPWFSLGGVACARRSTLAAHFAALETGSTGEGLHPDAGAPGRA